MFCEYYQAKINRSEGWFLVATLKSFDHMAFDRTLDKKDSIYEFFVPKAFEEEFLSLMNYLKKENVVISLDKRENRLKFVEI
jgi:hypothetical protein